MDSDDRRAGRRPWRAWAADAALAVGLAALGVVGTSGADDISDTDVAVDGVAFALVVLAALALAGRRWAPLATLVAVAGAASAYLVLGYPYGPILLSVLIAGYSAARHRPVRRAAAAGALALGVLLIHVFAPVGGPGLLGVVPGSAWVVVPFALGATVRVTRESAARNRAEQLRRRADAERLRVAQEVHDVVGHGLAAINLRAEIALHVLPKDPGQAVPALTAIARTSREALDELRVTLDLVRRDEGEDPRAPTAGLARLDDLVVRMTGTGVPVSVRTSGERRELPVAVDLAAYRVVQESLTNVLRHAGAASATVRLDYRPRELVVEVADDGRAGGGASLGPGGGRGIAGMRERVAALGGAFEAGPRAGGGFRVRAALPLPRPSSSPPPEEEDS